MDDIRSQLKEFDSAWREAVVEDEFKNLPDGKYQVSIDEIRFENAKKSGRLQLAWVLTVISPQENKGRKIFHYRGLDNEESVKWMKKEMFICGLDSPNISDLPDKLPSILDSIIEVTLKTKKTANGEFQNCFINKLLDIDEFESTEFAEDDCPF